MSVKKNNFNISIFVYIAFAFFYFWMAAQIPYTHDDWDWGIDIGLRQFLHATVNSRYIGNLFVIIMTRSELLKILIMGSTCFFIPYSLSSLAAKELNSDRASSRTFLFIVCNCLMFTMNQILWRQTYGWVSGFSNFAISSLFLICWIKEIFIIVDRSTVYEKDSLSTAVFYFVVCICGQLFIENITIFNFLLSAALVVVHLLKYKRIPGRILSMFAGSFIGLIVMFSSSIYSTLLQDGTAIDNYRQIPILSRGGIFDIFYRTFKSILLLGIRLYSLNYILFIVILLLFIIYLIKLLRTKKEKIYKSFLLINIALIFAFFFCWINDKVCSQHSMLMHCFDFLLSFVYFCIILIQTIKLFDNKTKNLLISLWISAPLVILPLVATTETGHRLFFTSNIFIVLFSLVLTVSLINNMSKQEYVVIKGLFICFAAVLLCFYINIYAKIGEMNRTRMKIIDETLQKSEAAVILPAFPYADYLHYPNPNESYRVEYFKAFYDIPTEVPLIFEQ